MLRLVIALALIVATAVFAGWVGRVGGLTEIVAELFRIHEEKSGLAADSLESRLAADLALLAADRGNSVSVRTHAAADIGKLALARKKAFHEDGLALRYGVAAAQYQMVNGDNGDLHQAVPLLVQSLGDPDERLRLESAFALAHLGLTDKQAHFANDIAGVLRNEYSTPIRAYLARALGDIGAPAHGAAVTLSAMLLEDDPEQLVSVAYALARMGPQAYSPETEGYLLSTLSHRNPLVREYGAEALGRIGGLSRQTSSALRQALRDDVPRVRVMAALALADLAQTDERVVAALVDGLRLPPATTVYVRHVARMMRIKTRAAAAIIAFGEVPEEAVPVLLDYLHETRDFMEKEQLIEVLARSEVFSALRAQALLDLARSPTTGVYYAVVSGLVVMGEEVRPLAMQLLEDGSPAVREQGEAILAALERRLPVVEDAPADAGVLAHWRAQLARGDYSVLAQLRAQAPAAADVSAALVQAFERERDDYQREELVKTLAEIGGPAALDTILAAKTQKLLYLTVFDVAVEHLIFELRRAKFHGVRKPLMRRRAIASLGYLGVLTPAQVVGFHTQIDNPELGDQVRDAWYLWRRAARLQADVEGQIPSGIGKAVRVKNSATRLWGAA